ncbi:hypothetical protein HID58_002378, partial [Brassica napus]
APSFSAKPSANSDQSPPWGQPLILLKEKKKVLQAQLDPSRQSSESRAQLVTKHMPIEACLPHLCMGSRISENKQPRHDPDLRVPVLRMLRIPSIGYPVSRLSVCHQVLTVTQEDFWKLGKPAQAFWRRGNALFQEVLVYAMILLLTLLLWLFAPPNFLIRLELLLIDESFIGLHYVWHNECHLKQVFSESLTISPRRDIHRFTDHQFTISFGPIQQAARIVGKSISNPN